MAPKTWKQFAASSAVASGSAGSWNALGKSDGMRNGAGNKSETFHRAAWFTWKRDDERAIHHCGQAARENGIWRNLHRFTAHHLPEAGNLYAHDRANRFGRDVARTNAGATRGQDQTAPLLSKRANRFLNANGIVGHDGF